MARIDTPFDLTTPQGIFDHVATRLIEQGHPATASSGICRYLVPDTGCRCAVGHLMSGDPDILHKLGGSIANDETWAFLDERIIIGKSYGLLSDLQSAHDGAAHASERCQSSSKAFLKAFRSRMKEVAYNHNLSAKVLRK